MSFKTTYILFGVLLALLVIFGLTQLFGPKPGAGLYVMKDLRDAKVTAEQIDTVEIDRAAPHRGDPAGFKPERLVFVRDPDEKQWRMTRPYEARIESNAINLLVERAVNAQQEQKVDVPPSLKDAGLEPPAAVVTLKRGVDQEWKLNLGKETLGGEFSAHVFVTSSGRPKEPLPVKRSALDQLFKSVGEFRSKDLLGGGGLDSASQIQSVTLQQDPKRDPLVLKKGEGGRWNLEKPPYGDVDMEGDTAAGPDMKTITGMRGLLSAVEAIAVPSADDFVAQDVTDFAKYGLEEDKPERLRIDIERRTRADAKKPTTATLLVGKKVEPKKDAKDDKKPAAEKYYARLKGEKHVVQINADSIAGLTKLLDDPAVLRNRDLVQLDQQKADAINIKNAAGQLRLRKTGAGPFGDWKLFTGAEGRKADDRVVQELLSHLTRKRQVKSFPAEGREKELGFDKPTAEIALWIDGIKPEEKKEEKKDDKKDDKAKGDAKKDDKKDDKKEEKKEEKKDPNAEPVLKSEEPTVRLIFGKREDNLVYVKRQVGKEKPVLLAIDAAPLLDKLNDGPLAYLDRMLPPLPPPDTVTRIVLLREGQTHELERVADAKPPAWTVQRPEDFKGRNADAGKVSGILNIFQPLEVEKFVAEKPSESELDAKFGLKSPAYQVTLTTKDKEGKTAEHVFLFGKETENKGSRYAKTGKSDLIFLVRSFEVVRLQGELLDPTVFAFDASKVKGLKLTGWQPVLGTPFTLDLEQAGSGWTVKSPPNFALDAAKVADFVKNLANLKALSFQTGAPKPEHKLELKDGALQIAVTFEGDKEPSYTLTVGALNPNAKGHYAQNNKLAKTVLLLPEELFKAALEKPGYFSK